MAEMADQVEDLWPKKSRHKCSLTIPSIIGVAVLFGICYVMSSVPLTGTQLFLAFLALVVVYAATVFWYIRTTL